MTRCPHGSRPAVPALRAAGSALAIGMLAAGAAAPAHALDLSGTITTREVQRSSDGHDTKDVTVVWHLSGSLSASSGFGEATARPEVLSYQDRTAYTTEFGDAVCYSREFGGWVEGAQNPVEQRIAFTMASKNELTRRSPAEVRLLDRGPAALQLSGDCGGERSVSTVPFVGSDNQGGEVLGLYRRVMIGLGNLETATGRTVTQYGGPSAYLAPGRVSFSLADGWWRSASSVSRTGRYAAGVFGSGTKTVTVSWNLRSKSPSKFCKLPARRLAKGKTVGAARRLLHRAGLRPGGLIADWSARSVRPGRVTGYATGGPVPGAQRCGSKVSIWIRPGSGALASQD
jgi:hypothetical protein